MIPKNLPQDINIELLLSYFPMGSCKVVFQDVHKHYIYNDLTSITDNDDGTMTLATGRNSLYNILPEYLFHPIDRFDNLPEDKEKERFAQELEAQEKEKAAAYKFFAPFDLALLQLRTDIRETVNQFVESDKAIIDLIADTLTEQQKQNRFIKQAMGFLPMCKRIRGNKTMISFMLRKIGKEEGLWIEEQQKEIDFTDHRPRYQNHLTADLDALYVGNCYTEVVTVYVIHYWPESECDEHFLSFLDDIEEFRSFIQDYFMAIDELLSFEIVTDDNPVRLADEQTYYYLNYNTNL